LPDPFHVIPISDYTVLREEDTAFFSSLFGASNLFSQTETLNCLLLKLLTPSIKNIAIAKRLNNQG